MVVQVVNPQTFQGLSTDDKPNAENGSTFHVINTGEVLIMHEGMWVADLRSARNFRGLMFT